MLRFPRCSPGLLALPLVALGLLLAVLLLRTYSSQGPTAGPVWGPSKQLPLEPGTDEKGIWKENLKGAIRIPTVSFSKDDLNTTAMEEFNIYIKKVFPGLFSCSFIQHEIIGGYSHLFSVKGSDPHLEPYMMLAHSDVVPASDEGWNYPPFAAKEVDGFIYGRGTLDDKGSAIGILQALDFLLKIKFRPQRSFYVGIGHDEEVYGHRGAQQIAARLEAQGVRLSFLTDEGLAILDRVIQGMNHPIALIGTTEKGHITMTLSVEMKPGHSSIPPRDTSIGILATAVSRLEQNPMPNLFGSGPERATFEQLAPEFSFPINVIMSNLWLFAPLVSRILEGKPSSNAMVRTTTAVTMFHAGVKSNIIPPSASATVNFRIHPAHTVQEVIDIVKHTISDDRVKITIASAFDPLPVSPYDEKSFGYQIVGRTIRDVFSEITFAPGVCVGNTDSRHYVRLTQSIYRFSPIWLKPEDVSRIHGVNERISVQGYELLVHFYLQLIQNAETEVLPPPHRESHEL
ncbi:N-fatty-acyl-amino acid synthase/hydrolase PM20D1 isoform X1 [Pleurodeles waltl]|uniref:N-fatty-acyl-amino acid synthase/hydrolase PM20D1 isoform X1 n=1 Tax=Pleurodeles waltl TaxID=8319 RepID=UPI0037099799